MSRNLTHLLSLFALLALSFVACDDSSEDTDLSVGDQHNEEVEDSPDNQDLNNPEDLHETQAEDIRESETQIDDLQDTETQSSDLQESDTQVNPCIGPFLAEPSFEDTFEPDWEDTQTTWRRASWMQNGTQMSPDRCVTSEEGYLEQTVMPGSPFLGGSVQSSIEFRYGRWVARLKPSAVPGALNSLFTMDWDDLQTPDVDGDGTHQEIDIEFLTYTFGENSGQVHFAVHYPGHTNYFVEDVDLDFNPSDDFHEWGFDILPDRIEWHVDGQLLATFEYDETVNMDGFYELFLNSWTKEAWIHGPPTEEAIYQVDWIRFYSYSDACAP